MKLNNFIKKSLTLEIQEFLGICQIMSIELFKGKEKEPKDFYELVYEMAEKYQGYNGNRKKQIDKILKAAARNASETKKERE